MEKSPSHASQNEIITSEAPESLLSKALIKKIVGKKGNMKGKVEFRLCFNVRNDGALKQ